MTTPDTDRFTKRGAAIAHTITEAEHEAREARRRATELRAEVERARQKRIDLIAEMRSEGMTWREIGPALDLTHQRVLAIAKRHGIH